LLIVNELPGRVEGLKEGSWEAMKMGSWGNNYLPDPIVLATREEWKESIVNEKRKARNMRVIELFSLSS
jgi:hypothetical protein